MRLRLLVTSFFFLLAFLVPNRAVAAVESSKFSGDSAFAYFSITDPSDTCLVSIAYVSATDGRIKEGAGKPQVISEVNLSIYKYNQCDGELLIDAFGYTTISSEALQVDQKLSSATLVTTVNVCDFITGNCFPVAIDLIWSGTGNLIQDKGKFHSNFGSCKIHSDFKGSFRDAVATGSLTALGENIASEPSIFAQIADVKSGTTFINCE